MASRSSTKQIVRASCKTQKAAHQIAKDREEERETERVSVRESDSRLAKENVHLCHVITNISKSFHLHNAIPSHHSPSTVHTQSAPSAILCSHFGVLRSASACANIAHRSALAATGLALMQSPWPGRPWCVARQVEHSGSSWLSCSCSCSCSAAVAVAGLNNDITCLACGAFVS